MGSRTTIVLCISLLTVVAQADTPRELSFNDAITVALAHNGDLYLARAATELATDDVALANSAFDPRLVATARASDDNELGGTYRLAWTDLLATGSVEYDGRARTGAAYSIGITSTADKYQSPLFTIYSPAYTTGITLTFMQPLLRNAWRKTNEQPIVVASLRQKLTEQELRVRLEQIVGDVEVAYWNLALAHNEVAARQASVKLAQEQLAESKRLIHLGVISDLDVVEAQAGVGRMERDLIIAGGEVATAEGSLRRVIVGDPSWSPDDKLVPKDSPTIELVSYSVQEHLDLARKNRPDVIAAHAAVEAEAAALEVTANDLKPELDFIGSAALVGFAGTVDSASGALPPTVVPDAASIGGPGKALENLVTAGGYQVSVGLRLELPLVNGAAKARHAHQLHAVSRARIAENAILAQVENEVRTSIARLQVDEALATAADEAVKTNEQLLAGMRKRFSAGAVTSYEVLRVSDELTRAQIEAARARVSYRVSLARLATADGTLLQRHNITLASLHPAK